MPDQLQWMVDFDRAVAAGMALAIDLTPDQYAAGFTRLLVLGLQLGTPPPTARQRCRNCSHIISGAAAASTCCRRVRRRTTQRAPAPDPLRKTIADASFDDRKNRPLFTR